MQTMPRIKREITFRLRDFRGSRFRCLLATGLPKPKFVEWMNSLIQPSAKVSEKDKCMPEGFLRPDEAKLGQIKGFLDERRGQTVSRWWLAIAGGAITPNWDLVSTCTIDGRKGLVLLEAKAHEGELHLNDHCGAENEQNRKQIIQAIGEASKALGKGWRLTAYPSYQLSNRFAWAWKVASLGKPVVLVYLGFLNAYEMDQPFENHAAWERYLREYAKTCVPGSAWNSRVMVKGTPLIALIRSADVNVIAA